MDLDRIEEILEEVKKLAHDKGYVLHDEIESLIGDEIEMTEIVKLYDRLSEESIEFFDSDEKARLKIDARSKREQRDAKRSEEAMTAGVRFDDPVRMYLREMGKVPLLDREGEIEIAKRIESGNLKVSYSIFTLPATTERLREFVSRLEKGEMRLEDVVLVETTGLHPQLSGRKEIRKHTSCLRRIIKLREECAATRAMLHKRSSKKRAAELTKELE
ncbi:MAG: sigma-70 factor domain-containing protein, partial [Candidatus Krumholzibacteria bacterium]|nr:sigma-70 factor domain-containing protein [Candidatus Krumholzibacteria bacterium]